MDSVGGKDDLYIINTCTLLHVSTQPMHDMTSRLLQHMHPQKPLADPASGRPLN